MAAGATVGRTSLLGATSVALRARLESLRQKKLQPLQGGPVRRTQEAVVANLVEAPRQHVLQVTTQEFLGRQSHGFPLASAGMLIAEAHGSVVQGEEPVVGDGDAMHVAPEIAQHFARPVEGRSAEDDPFPVPYLLGKLFPGERPPGQLHEARPEHLGQCPHRDQELPARLPPDAVLVEPSGRHQHVYVRVVLQGAGPGVQHGQDAEFASHEPGVEPDPAQGVDGRAHEYGVEFLLVAAHRVAQLMGQGEDQMEVAHRQKLGLPLLQPV